MTTRQFCLVFALFFIVSALGLAQTDATVSGTVTDQTGAHVVGATVTALKADTGTATTTQTNQAGVYVFPALPPGQYRFTAEQSGFRRATVSDVTLAVGAKLTINLPLELGQTSETVEVQASATEVNTSNATVGDVISGQKLLGLPLAGRSSYDLIATQPGVVQGAGTSGSYNINGNRGNAINFTTDGINSNDNLLVGSFYLYSNLVSVDRAEEFRVVTSPADAEYGRGAGQIQMITRSGTNAYHGSAWEEFRNTDLNANDFFNNITGTPRNVLHQNQYGIRAGGPVKKNKTFFNGIYEGQRQRQVIATTQTVYTQSARNGIFRYYPGVQNGNAIAANPSVDLAGNPITPNGATGPLQSVSVFGRDPNRMVADPSGVISKQLGLIPLPNNFRAGDGLNTAGFTWSRPFPTDYGLYEGRIDHMFNTNHRISLVLNHQAYNSFNVAFPQAFPTVPGSPDPTETTQYSVAFTSVIRPNLLNEVRIGVFRPRTIVLTPEDAKPELLPVTAGGVPYILSFANITSPFPSAAGGASNRITPVYQYGDTLTWIKGRHSFKGGVELRFISDPGFEAFGARPGASVGAGAVPVQNVNNIPGIGTNAGLAQNTLLDLTGSFAFAFQVNNSPGGPNPQFLPGQTRYRSWRQRELDWFFKDDIKVSPSFTLNLGIRYEFYGVPTEPQGRMLAPVGGSAGIFGLSGTNLANSLFQPGAANGTLTRTQLIGDGTPNPGVQLYNNDYNNFAPAVGFAWNLPWFGKDKTVIRAGYGVGYERLPIYLTHTNSGMEPGLSETDTLLFASLQAPLLNVQTLVLPVKPAGAPLALVPATGAASRTQNVYAYDTNFRSPYYQNYNFTIERALSPGMSFSLGFVGSKGTKLTRTVNLNESNIYENGILQAFQTIQAGGTSPLIEQIFGAGGSNLVRTNSATQGFFANNNVGGFADFINRTTSLGAGVPGGLLAKANLPNNFVVLNPQFLNVYLTGNYGNSTYNSLQAVFNRRFTHGLVFQASYVFSKALGEDEGDSSTLQSTYRTLRNESLDKRRLNFDRTHVFKMNGIYELPFGRGKMFGRNANGFVDRVIGGWQIGTIFNKFSGQPLTITGANTVNTFGTYTPNIVGTIPDGGVHRVGNGVVYFSNIGQIVDPSVGNLTASLRPFSGLRAITVGGSPILVNSAPGVMGAAGQGIITGPGTFRFDVNLIKHIAITERIRFQIGATAQNLTNTEQFGNPNLNINDLNFGRITGSAPYSNAGVGTSSPARIVVIQARITF
jgi:carboxypeptidase family protein/TonB-dependent receptor-like protein